MLAEQVVIVVGGRGGLGSAIVRRAAREGARVVIADVGATRDGSERDEEASKRFAAELVHEGFDILGLSTDPSTPQGADAVVRAAVERFGRVDALINTAGVVRDSSLIKLELSDFETVYRATLHTALFASQAFARHVIAEKSTGRIVNVTGTAGILGNLGQAAQASAQASLIALTRTASIEWQRHGVHVNALVPLAKTRTTADLPMFRSVDSLTPDHVAPAAVFLASALAGDRTGYVLGMAGARAYGLKIVETSGQFKDDADGVWTPEELGEHWDAIFRS